MRPVVRWSSVFVLVCGGCPGTLDPTEFGACLPPKEYFQKTCAGSTCHDSGSANVDLVSGGLEDRLLETPSVCMGEKLVVPESPKESVLYQKLAGSPVCGSRMPLGGDHTSDVQLDCIADFIASLEK